MKGVRLALALVAAALVFGAAADSRLAGLQDRVESALAAPSDLDATLAVIEGELAALRADDAPSDYHRNYWTAYLLFRQAQVLMLITGDREQARHPLQEAMALLEETTPRDVEVLALHGMVAGMHFAYVPMHRFFEASIVAQTALNQALELGGDNMRALYANALTNYHTPERFGGGKAAEGLLKDALAAPEAASDGLAPRWGRREATALLAHIYVERDRAAEARALLQDALAKWPDDPMLRRLDARTRETAKPAPGS